MAQPSMRSPYDPGGLPPAPGVAAPPGRRLQLSLAIVAGMVALLCMGGIGMAYALYDKVTAPDRSAPDVAVDNYLRAALVERDAVVANQFVCREPSLHLIDDLKSEIQRREDQFDVTVWVSWGPLMRQSVAEDRELVDVELVIMGVADGVTQSRRSEQWTFDVVNERGWRVCGVSRSQP